MPSPPLLFQGHRPKSEKERSLNLIFSTILRLVDSPSHSGHHRYVTLISCRPGHCRRPSLPDPAGSRQLGIRGQLERVHERARPRDRVGVSDAGRLRDQADRGSAAGYALMAGAEAERIEDRVQSPRSSSSVVSLMKDLSRSF
jgi:hypothetical protein